MTMLLGVGGRWRGGYLLLPVTPVYHPTNATLLAAWSLLRVGRCTRIGPG